MQTGWRAYLAEANTKYKVSEAEDCLPCLISISEELKGGQCGGRGENEGDSCKRQTREAHETRFCRASEPALIVTAMGSHTKVLSLMEMFLTYWQLCWECVKRRGRAEQKQQLGERIARILVWVEVVRGGSFEGFTVWLVARCETEWLQVSSWATAKM